MTQGPGTEIGGGPTADGSTCLCLKSGRRSLSSGFGSSWPGTTLLCTQAGFTCCSFRSSGATPRSMTFAKSRRVTNVPVRRTISITDRSPLIASLCISRISSRHLLHSHKPPGVADVALVLAELRVQYYISLKSDLSSLISIFFFFFFLRGIFLKRLSNVIKLLVRMFLNYSWL